MRTLERNGNRLRQVIPWEDYAQDAHAWKEREKIWRSLSKDLVRVPVAFSTTNLGVCIESEWIPGLDLREFADEYGAEKALLRFLPAIRKLHKLHQGSPAVLHGDVSPKNLLLTQYDAFWIDLESLETVVGAGAHSHFRAKPAYLAPERARYGRNSVAAEVFACAAIVYELIRGSPLFSHSLSGFSAALEFSEAKLVEKLRAIPGICHGVLRRGLAPDPGTRPSTALCLLEELERAFR